jgi:hypothetical protein
MEASLHLIYFKINNKQINKYVFEEVVHFNTMNILVPTIVVLIMGYCCIIIVNGEGWQIRVEGEE